MVWVNAIGVAGLLAGDHRIAAAQRPRRDVALPINPSTFPSRRPLATGRHPEGAGEPVRRIRVAGPRRRLRHRLARPASHHRDVPAAPKRLTGHSTTRPWLGWLRQAARHIRRGPHHGKATDLLGASSPVANNTSFDQVQEVDR
jgi:hypothetical protein